MLAEVVKMSIFQTHEGFAEETQLRTKYSIEAQ